MITILLAPESAPQIPKPTPQPPPTPPILDWIDQRILDLVRECQPVKLWPILNLVAEDLSPRSRAEGREVRMKLWHKVRRLIGLGLIFRVGRNSVATVKPKAKPPTRRVRCRKRTVTQSTTARAVSENIRPNLQEAAHHNLPSGPQVVIENRPAITPGKKEDGCESVPAPELVTNAARALAALPRRPARRWSGWIGPVRSYRDMPILLPKGRPAWVFGAQRNKVIVTLDKGRLLGTLTPGQRWGVLPSTAIRFVKNENAIVLGSRKRGTRERPSALKAAADRRNGSIPARRRRGRPPRHQVSPPGNAPDQTEPHEPLQLRSLASSP